MKRSGRIIVKWAGFCYENGAMHLYFISDPDGYCGWKSRQIGAEKSRACYGIAGFLPVSICPSLLPIGPYHHVANRVAPPEHTFRAAWFHWGDTGKSPPSAMRWMRHASCTLTRIVLLFRVSRFSSDGRSSGQGAPIRAVASCSLQPSRCCQGHRYSSQKKSAVVQSLFLYGPVSFNSFRL